ncbi:hypothetical protein FHP29_16165 [Nocardioides albidus]|uniref:Uncharacterized protein n=1 Tax=Nocardioides albidus TaxID=1517589 RepID=A0A5C4VND5_9ACTN|nr:hypothetical protein FHP29_16165 [Nocardioides albidus]
MPVRRIQQRVDLDQSVLVDLPDVEVPPIGCLLSFGFGPLGVEPQHRLRDEAFELRPADAGGGEQLPIDERRRLRAQGAGEVGAPFGPPRRQPPGQDRVVDVGQPPGALDHPPDVRLPTIRGAAEDRDQLHQRELADQRGTFPGDRDAGVEVALGDRGNARWSGDDVIGGPGDDAGPFADHEGFAVPDPRHAARTAELLSSGAGFRDP